MQNRKLLIGTCGFHYKDWPGKFYPEKLPAKDWLKYFSQHFETVELNSSFYRTPSKKTILNWINNTPKKFLFTIKASRMITHYLRLKYCEVSLKNFFKIARPFATARKLTCLLYQLPPNFKKDTAVLESFLKLLPRKFHHVLEFRHESWNEEETYSLLKKYKTTYCIVSSGRLQSHLISTTDIVYIRFHGPKEMYSSKYSDEELKIWAKHIKKF